MDFFKSFMDFFNSFTDFVQRIFFWRSIVSFWPFVRGKLSTHVSFVSFKNAIMIMDDCGYYAANGHERMWENAGITRESYYISLLTGSIRDGEISLYGRKNYSSNKKLQKIEANNFKELNLEENCNVLSSEFSNGSRENLYIDLSFKNRELKILIEKLKKIFS